MVEESAVGGLSEKEASHPYHEATWEEKPRTSLMKQHAGCVARQELDQRVWGSEVVQDSLAVEQFDDCPLTS